MINPNKKILVIGYGNPGRLDDGLGPLVSEFISQKSWPSVSVDANYLLTVEDAADISEYDIVIFVDASVNGAEPFYFKQIQPKPTLNFSSHHNEPENILGLAHEMFQAKTKGYVLGIRGYDFDEFGQKISDKAQNNLLEAIGFLEKLLQTKDFSQYSRKKYIPTYVT